MTIPKKFERVAIGALIALGIYVYIHFAQREVRKEYPQLGSSSVSAMVEFEVDKNEWSFPVRNQQGMLEADAVPGREVRYEGDNDRIKPWPPGKHYSVPTSVRFVQIRSTETRMSGAGVPYQK